MRLSAQVIVVGTAVCGATLLGLLLLGLLLLGGARPHAPDLAGWLDGESSAFHSPRLAASIRGD